VPDERASDGAAPWHALLAPLPGDAVARRKALVPPELLHSPDRAAIAGWEQVTVELSAPGVGNRVAMVLLDAANVPISASDMVLYRSTAADEAGRVVVEYRTESVGGRLEADGSFRGTRWSTVSTEVEGEEPEDGQLPMTTTRSAPTDAEEAGLKALVAELLRREPARDHRGGAHGA
jgi:hypothetical protein